jgi:hypothetical protein
MPGRVTLFDRLALAVGGAVVGYVSGLALGGTAFLPIGATLNLNPVIAGRFFFYYLPIGIGATSALGAALVPEWTANSIAKIWELVVTMCRMLP